MRSGHAKCGVVVFKLLFGVRPRFVVVWSCCLASAVALAQNTPAPPSAAPPNTPPPDAASSGKIELAQLPAPPIEIAELLRRAGVKFTYGAEEMPTGAMPTSGRRHDALTDYKLSYRYRTQDRAQVAGSRQEIVTTFRAGTASLANKHVVWFRKLPEFETFWTNRLVLHELDHVRISSDPRLEERFREQLAAVVLPARPASQIVRDRAEECFQRVSSLVAIRYHELDRLTIHGSRELPEGSSLDSLLRSPR